MRTRRFWRVSGLAVVVALLGAGGAIHACDIPPDDIIDKGDPVGTVYVTVVNHETTESAGGTVECTVSVDGTVTTLRLPVVPVAGGSLTSLQQGYGRLPVKESVQLTFEFGRPIERIVSAVLIEDLHPSGDNDPSFGGEGDSGGE